MVGVFVLLGGKNFLFNAEMANREERVTGPGNYEVDKRIRNNPPIATPGRFVLLVYKSEMVTVDTRSQSIPGAGKSIQTVRITDDSGSVLYTPPNVGTEGPAHRVNLNAPAPLKRKALGTTHPEKNFSPGRAGGRRRPYSPPRQSHQRGPCAPQMDELYEFAINKLSLIELPDPPR